jgi:hypothetical protein
VVSTSWRGTGTRTIQEIEMKQSLQPRRTSSPRGKNSCHTDGTRVNTKLRRPWLLAATTGLLLAACGGGGDAAPAAPVAAAYAVNAAQRHLLMDGGSWSMDGTVPNGGAFRITMNFAPSTAGPFPLNGATAARSLQTPVVQAAGQSDSVAQTIYFDPVNLSFLGVESGGACNLATSSATLPNSAAVGEGGTFFSGSDLDGCTGASRIVGTTTIGWSLETDTGVVLLCWNLAFTDAIGAADGTQSNCVEIAADGALGARARFAASALGMTVSARNF